MIADIRDHLNHYAILAFLLMAGLLGFLWFEGNTTMELVVLILTGIGYVFWGIVHHRKDDEITVSLVGEYVLTAVLVIILVWGVFTNL